jgi:hypothetical protein
MTAVNDIEAIPASPESSDHAEADRSLVSVRGFARGDQIELKNAVVGAGFAQRMSISRAFVRAAIGARSVEVRQAGAGLIATAGGASVQQGGAQAIVSTGSVTMRQGGSGIAIGRSVSVDNGLVIFGIAPRIDVGTGGRVVFGPLASLAVIGSAAALVGTAALLVRISRSRVT